MWRSSLLMFVAIAILVGALAWAHGCSNSEVIRTPCMLVIVNPTDASAFETMESQVILGGTISGAAFATWDNSQSGATGVASVTYASPGAGSWMTDALTLVDGMNRIRVTARRDGIADPVCASDSITVTKRQQGD